MSNASEIRKQSWETRRKKYGPSGHSGGCYITSHRSGASAKKMFDLIIRLHSEGILSEGQVVAATDVDRISVREARLRYEERIDTLNGPRELTREELDQLEDLDR